MKPTISIIFTVHRSSGNIPPLLSALREFCNRNAHLKFEAVFVVDGSPDDSFELLKKLLGDREPFTWQLCDLIRNFGAPLALKQGLKLASGDYFCNFACDQQEPFEFITDAFKVLNDSRSEVAMGTRAQREDPFLTSLTSRLYWKIYRKIIDPRVPPGGLDIFLISRRVRDVLLALPEKNQFLLGLILWTGFPLRFVPYERRKRTIGTSSWTLAKRLRYLVDSVFKFSDLPVRALIWLGAIGLTISLTMACLLAIAKWNGSLNVPGYAATVTVICFFGGLNSMGLGILGMYIWAIFENAQGRPHVIVNQTISKAEIRCDKLGNP